MRGTKRVREGQIEREREREKEKKERGRELFREEALQGAYFGMNI